MPPTEPTPRITSEAQPKLPRRDRWVTLAMAAFAIAAGSVAFIVDSAARQRGAAITSGILAELGTLAFILTLAVVGVLLRVRLPDHRFGWLLVAFSVVVGTSALLWSSMLVSSATGGDPRLGTITSWIGGMFSPPTWTYLITQMVVRFPSGAPETPREATILRVTAWTSLLAAIGNGLRPGPIVVYPAFENPLPIPEAWHGVLLAASNVALIVGLVPGVAAVAAMVGRYRSAADIERLQLRWFAFAAGLVLAASLLYLVGAVFLFATNAAVRDFTYALVVLSGCGLPVAVFVAITRYRLYEIDRIIGRTFAYGALTAILAGLYSASVRLFNALFVALTGEESEAALVLTTLVLATTFTPIKSFLEKAAARRFPATTDPGIPGASGGSVGPAPDDDLDARIEAIARRVAAEVLAERPTSAPAAAPARVDTPER